jgi:predicted DNA binding CopG/RHH family protein
MPDTKLTVRCTEDLLAAIKIRAIEERTTVTELVTRIVTEYLEAAK